MTANITVQTGHVSNALLIPAVAKQQTVKASFVKVAKKVNGQTQITLVNVMLPLVYGKVKDMEERATKALQRVGLGDRLDHNPNELSGGQQQRVAIARAIATRPRLLLADEPTGNLSSVQSEEIMQIVQELNDEGSTVVMVTHEPDIARHCKRVLSLRDGRMEEDDNQVDRLDAKTEIARLDAEQDARRAAKANSQGPALSKAPS